MSVYLGNNEVGIGIYEKPPQKPFTGLRMYPLYQRAKIKMDRFGTSQQVPSISLLYSLDDGASWQPYTLGTWVTVDKGSVLGRPNSICWMAGPEGNTRFAASPSDGWRFRVENGNSSVSLGGNIMSLLTQDYENALEVPSCGFARMFGSDYSDESWFSISEGNDFGFNLPATVVGDQGYAYMFYRQNQIMYMPDLPATTIGQSAYEYMFYGTYLGGYDGEQCKGKVLPCIEPGFEAYWYMFGSCQRLYYAPIVLASDGNYACSAMFSGCYDLKEAVLPYAYSFDGQVFDGCRGIRYIELGELTFKPRIDRGGQPNGIIAANTDFQGVYPSDYMPTGWTYVCKTTGEVLTPPEN